ncbi:MAG: MBOAT family O-acyltransferase [Bacteroidota bacterium]|nr:MBOAT family O-acyltransferase [Bacteroidota bacterium]
MIFNSLSFVFFFIVVTTIYYLLPHRFRWFILLTASCFFYMFFKPVYILILAGTILIDYLAGIQLEKIKDQKRKRFFLILSLIANIGVLLVFKYYNFINENITSILTQIGMKNPVPFLKILLPIGLSFHTFQAMSYTIEVYRGNQKAEKHFGIYALYVMFYPQLVAGPIERPQNILHQFHEKHPLLYGNISAGLKLMLWGLFKKVVIADRLAIGVNEVYDNLHEYTGIPLVLATVMFSIQIYCDFSGYSDIALGSARVMGFRLMENFNRPYASTTISEFWSRWHISLSTWFRDYLYIPLGGNRVKVPRWYFNLFFVFLVSGIWHGANWTFIIWGAIHGFYLIFAIIMRPIGEKIRKIFQKGFLKLFYNLINLGIVFALTTFAWLFFRAQSLNDAIYVIKNSFKLNSLSVQRDLYLNSGQDFFIVAVFVILFMEVVQYINANFNNILFNGSNKILRWAFCLVLLIMICTLGVFHSDSEFIYFQF